MKLPDSLMSSDLEDATDLMRCYYGVGEHAHHAGHFQGARFDTFGREVDDDPDRFSAQDVCALALLSVNLQAHATLEVLDYRADRLSELLVALGPDRDLASETEAWPRDWPGWQLWRALTGREGIAGIGPTKASKLIARKRPRLRPIYDSVVRKTLGSANLWDPLRLELQGRPGLHNRLLEIRDRVGLESITAQHTSAIRVFDVVTWMTGKGYSQCPSPPS